MPLSVQEVTREDFPEMLKFVWSKDGQLTSPAADVCFPVDDEEKGKLRNDFSIQQQLDIFDNDPTAKYMKVVDTDKNNEIVSLARWHYYKDGYETSDLEYAGTKDKNADVYPPGLHVPMYKGILSLIFDNRRSWMGEGPYWILCTIKTREPLQKRGAGGLLVEWGVDKAKQQGCPAYLEAAADALSLYKKKGFREVGDIKVDLNEYGIPSEAIFKKMVANKD